MGLDSNIEKSISVQSLEGLLGMDIIAIWKDYKKGNELEGSVLNIRVFERRARVEMTIVWEFKELKDMKPI